MAPDHLTVAVPLHRCGGRERRASVVVVVRRCSAEAGHRRYPNPGSRAIHCHGSVTDLCYGRPRSFERQPGSGRRRGAAARSGTGPSNNTNAIIQERLMPSIHHPTPIRFVPAAKPSRRGPSLTVIALPLLAACAVGTASAKGPFADDDANSKANSPYAIGLWGDMPYSDVQQDPGIPNLIADMNAQRLAFTVHDGDLKQGSNSLCDEALYKRSLGYFNSLEAPAMFTPGDNDWTDCDRPSNGGYNSLERLDYERSVFFSDSYSMGQRQLKQEVQTTMPYCLGAKGPTPCVENRRWHVGRVTYVTLNVQGSCNNLCDTAPDPDEYAARNAANIAWLQESFAVAEARHSVAVMLISQANPGWDQSDPTRAPLRDPKTLAQTQTDGALDGFQDFLQALRDEVLAFRKPVAYVHGDSHYFRVDKPFLDAQGRRLENFTRVETFGDNAGNRTNDVQWLKVLVDPRSREVFSYQPQIVPGNRVAVPAP